LPLDSNVVAWRYTADDGVTHYRLRAKKALVDQTGAGSAVKVGGQAATVSVPLPPRGFRPRRVYVASADGTVKRSVVAYSSSALIAAGGETITLASGGADTVFTSTGGVLGERRRAGITDSV
jgi:hypothetical protein